MALLALMLLALPPVQAQTVDYDTDDNRLIEVDSIAKLNAIRYDLNGSGTVSAGDTANYALGFPTPASGQCPTSCQGYELTADLTFTAAWTPIGTYNATFDGQGHTLSGLTVSASGGAGLFSVLGASGVIRHTGVISANVTTTGGVVGAGALVGHILSGGQVDASYSRGGTITVDTNSSYGGGLVGQNEGTIRASYSTAAVAGPSARDGVWAGGLIGYNRAGTIIASYAAGLLTNTGTTTQTGGLVGVSDQSGSTATDSYCDTQGTGQTNCVGVQFNTSNITVTGYTTSDLQMPTGYTGTIYANWNLDLDGDSNTNDDPWDFGTASQYPALKFDTDGSGTATAYEFGVQGRPDPNAPPPPPPSTPRRSSADSSPPYNPAHDHPEIYTNPRHEMATACAVETTGEGDDAISTSTLTFDLGNYTRPITLALSLWDGDVFRSLQSQNISMPELRQDGQTATVEVVTDPAQTRFRLDSQYGLNLVLGYADCHTDDP